MTKSVVLEGKSSHNSIIYDGEDKHDDNNNDDNDDNNNNNNNDRTNLSENNLIDNNIDGKDDSRSGDDYVYINTKSKAIDSGVAALVCSDQKIRNSCFL